MENNFVDSFWKSTQISDFMKNSLVGANSFHADGRTDRRNAGRRTDLKMLMAAFRYFTYVPKKCYIILVLI